MSADRALQAAVIAALRADPGVSGLVGARVYDVPPPGAALPFVSMGPSSSTPERQDGFRARRVVIQVDAWTEARGQRAPLRALCDVVADALDRAELTLADPYALALLEVLQLQILDDPGGVLRHGVLQFEAVLEYA
jgi:hypothetical protein